MCSVLLFLSRHAWRSRANGRYLVALGSNHIQSVPVYDKGVSRYIGTVSMFDVVMLALQQNVDEGDVETLFAGTTVRKLIGLYKEAKTV